MPDVLGDLIRRIEALEAAVQGRASDFFDRKLTKPMVAVREAKSPRQIERDVQNQVLPPPDEILNGRWYWWLSTLERHDRQRVQSPRRAPPTRGDAAAENPQHQGKAQGPP
jgi:hypothetical protein